MSGPGPSFLRIEQPLTGVADLTRWLRGRATLPRFSWLNRAGDVGHVGAGVGEIVRARDFGIVDEVVQRLTAVSDSGGPRLLVTARFDLGREPETPWSEFGRVTLWLPLLELYRRDGRTVLAVNLKTDPEVGGLSEQQRSWVTEELIGGLDNDDARWPSGAGATPRQTDGTSERAAWDQGVRSLLEAVEKDGLQKAVLARRAVRPYCGRPALERMQDVVERFPGTYRFCIEPTQGIAFLGASPERLYHRRGHDIDSEALGGTRPRGSDEHEDECLGSELMLSAKDAVEHRVVLSYIVERLRAACEQIEVQEASQLHKLPNVQHLRTLVRGRLREGVGDGALLGALHPTPAVCGQPREDALELLRTQERFDRGLYSGLVGLVGARDAEFTVAIRSALVQAGQVQLFAGAGIVAGSRPEDEWEETQSKLRAMGDLLAARDRTEGG